MSLNSIVNWYLNNGFHNFTTLDGGNAVVLQCDSDSSDLRLIAYAGWDIYQTSTRVGYGNYVRQGPWMNGATGQQYGSDGHYYNYLNIFALWGSRMYKPAGFQRVKAAFLHIESGGGYHDGTLCCRTIPYVKTKDEMNAYWVESTNYVIPNSSGYGYRFDCTNYMRKAFNGDSCYCTVDLLGASRWEKGSAQIYIKPFKKNGCYNSDWADSKPCFEISYVCNFNQSPTAKIGGAPDRAFVGNTFSVWSDSTDPDGDALSHSWSISPTSYSGSLSGSSGRISLNSPNTNYTITLTVNDGKGGTSTTSKVVYAQPKGTPKLNLSVSPKVTSFHIDTTQYVSFNIHGWVTNYSNSGKNIDSMKLEIWQLNKDYPGSGPYSVIDSWENIYHGEYTDKWANGYIYVAFNPSPYRQYFKCAMTIHYSDTNTYDYAYQDLYVDATNNAPLKPIISLPINDSRLHSKKPIFLVTYPKDPDGDSIQVLADIWNTSTNPWTRVLTMNSTSNNTNVSPSGWLNGNINSNVKIAPDGTMTNCISRLYTAPIDKYGARGETPDSICRMMPIDYIKAVIARDEITPDVVNFIINKINDNCWAYQVPLMDKVETGDTLDNNLVYIMIDHINSYVDKVNSWSSSNDNTRMTSASITIDYCNDSLLDVLNSIIDILFQ